MERTREKSGFLGMGDKMFWDRVSKGYDIFMKIRNNKGNKEICKEVVQRIETKDSVLECACGTGIISEAVGPRCKTLLATDLSKGMLERTRKKCRKFPNVCIESADILKLPYKDHTFDKVIAANVIHLLEDPAAALKELERVCKKGGKIILPTYIQEENNGIQEEVLKITQILGMNISSPFSYQEYIDFLDKNNYKNYECIRVEGKIPCAIVIIVL